MGGKGRSGTIAAILLIEFGNKNEEVINIVRKKRKGAIETKEQEDFILAYRTHS
jgi:ADP-ribosyl-[dinitrogen reductase] hydrolase